MYRQNDNNFWNFRLGHINHVKLSRYILRGRGIGGGVRENTAYCFLLRIANLLTFILCFHCHVIKNKNANQSIQKV